jgi:hypothetical protein
MVVSLPEEEATMSYATLMVHLNVDRVSKHLIGVAAKLAERGLFKEYAMNVCDNMQCSFLIKRDERSACGITYPESSQLLQHNPS